MLKKIRKVIGSSSCSTSECDRSDYMTKKSSSSVKGTPCLIFFLPLSESFTNF